MQASLNCLLIVFSNYSHVGSYVLLAENFHLSESALLFVNIDQMPANFPYEWVLRPKLLFSASEK